MDGKPNYQMLKLALEVRGMTQAQLVELTGIDPGTMSLYMGGSKSVPEYNLLTIAQALRFPIDFFFQVGEQRGVEEGEVFHRKSDALSSYQLKRIDAHLNVFRLTVGRLLEPLEIPKHLEIPQYDVSQYNGDIEFIAAAVRAAWHIPAHEPIRSVTEKLESAFCFVNVLDFQTTVKEMDEATQWVDPMRPVLLVNSRAPGDRLRFSLAHALGHLVMHHYRPPYQKMEEEAHRFAGAFLMPADEIIHDLKPVSYERLLQLKPYWGVSMQALIERGHELGVISDTRRSSLYQMLSRKRQRINEPSPLEPERPASFEKILRLYQNRLKFKISDFAALAHMSEEDFRNWYLPPDSVIPNLRILDKPTKPASEGQGKVSE